MHRKTPITTFAKHALVLFLLPMVYLSSISCQSKSIKKKTAAEEETKPETPIEFVVEESQVIVRDKLAKSKSSEIERIKEEEIKKIAQLVQGYYEAAFLKPALWENGEAGRVDRFFAPAVGSRIRAKDLDSLTLGDAAKKIDYLESIDARMPTVWIDINENLEPQLCATTTDVNAQFVQKDGGTAHFTSSATLFLEPTEGRRWQIFDYDLKYELKSEGESK